MDYYKRLLLLLCIQQALPLTLQGSKDSPSHVAAPNVRSPIAASSTAERSPDGEINDLEFREITPTGYDPAFPGSRAQARCGKPADTCFRAIYALPDSIVNKYPGLQALRCCAPAFCFPIPSLITLGICVQI